MKDTLSTTATLLKALGSDVRLRLLQALRGDQELCVCELVDALGRPHYAVSRDLAMLEKVGLVQKRRDGSWVYHALAPAAQSGGFAAELLRLLGDHLTDAPEVRADAERLARRMALRDGERCVVSVADFVTELPVAGELS
jgi:ArsR family transcriptional regulator, arsenate/arsenite/antimonite-responsive transcriptional repressor